jgi:hypothetical protein
VFFTRIYNNSPAADISFIYLRWQHYQHPGHVSGQRHQQQVSVTVASQTGLPALQRRESITPLRPFFVIIRYMKFYPTAVLSTFRLYSCRSCIRWQEYLSELYRSQRDSRVVAMLKRL